MTDCLCGRASIKDQYPVHLNFLRSGCLWVMYPTMYGAGSDPNWLMLMDTMDFVTYES